jgi:hypothetical protein
MDDSESKTSGHGSIHCVTALAQNGRTHLGSLRVNADHHGLAGMDWPQALCVAQLSRHHAADN